LTFGASNGSLTALIACPADGLESSLGKLGRDSADDPKLEEISLGTSRLLLTGGSSTAWRERREATCIT
jgi:hypothetical protein